MMKVSDYVAHFLKDAGITHVFAIQGGASAHLIDSLAKCDGIQYICNQHEQASAMAADGFARVSNGLGCAIATSGPGATNLLTGCCCAYYDSVPVLFITGQVASFRLKGEMQVRQIGFQETETVKIFSPVTKYAVLINKPEDIRYELEKAVHIALDGRKGPVLVDIPDDFQRSEVDVENLRPYVPKPNALTEDTTNIFRLMLEAIRAIGQAERPLIIAGWGIHLASAESTFQKFLERVQIPVVATWGGNDLLAETMACRVGTLGINGARYGNFAVQTADLLIVLGSRLDTHVAGTPLKNFAPNAKKIVVDIDQGELDKYARLDFSVNLQIRMDLNAFFDRFLMAWGEAKPRDLTKWRENLGQWKKKYPVYADGYDEKKELDPYFFVKTLSYVAPADSIFFCDTGCSLVWMSQTFEFQEGQRLFSAFNNTPMGYALPAAIGASFKTGKRIFCVTGDGGLQMNIQELATVVRHKLNITVFLFENDGYGMIQRTQDMWFDSIYEGSDVESGLAFPDFEKIFMTYGFKTFVVDKNEAIRQTLNKILRLQGPVCVVIKVPLEAPIVPQIKFGHGLEDMEPNLPREVIQNELNSALGNFSV